MSLTMGLIILGVILVGGGIIYWLSKQSTIINFATSNEAKGLLQSKTFWAAAVTLIMAVGGLVGWQIDEVSLTKIVEALLLILTTIITIIGRQKAKKPIDGLIKKK